MSNKSHEIILRHCLQSLASLVHTEGKTINFPFASDTLNQISRTDLLSRKLYSLVRNFLEISVMNFQVEECRNFMEIGFGTCCSATDSSWSCHECHGTTQSRKIRSTSHSQGISSNFPPNFHWISQILLHASRSSSALSKALAEPAHFGILATILEMHMSDDNTDTAVLGSLMLIIATVISFQPTVASRYVSRWIQVEKAGSWTKTSMENRGSICWSEIRFRVIKSFQVENPNSWNSDVIRRVPDFADGRLWWEEDSRQAHQQWNSAEISAKNHLVSTLFCGKFPKHRRIDFRIFLSRSLRRSSLLGSQSHRVGKLRSSSWILKLKVQVGIKWQRCMFMTIAKRWFQFETNSDSFNLNSTWIRRESHLLKPCWRRVSGKLFVNNSTLLPLPTNYRRRVFQLEFDLNSTWNRTIYCHQYSSSRSWNNTTSSVLGHERSTSRNIERSLSRSSRTIVLLVISTWKMHFKLKILSFPRS